jgi:hypothetical protein
MRPRLFSLALSLAAFAFAGAPSAATVTVRPDSEGPAVRPSTMAGYNFGNWMPVAEVRESLKEVPPGALRFPAGNAGDESNLDAAVLGTFAAALTLMPGQPELMVQTRVFQGRDGRPAANSPEDAAAAVKLARERGLNVTYWEVGNEPDLYGPVRGDTSWTAERYCDVFRAQAAAVRREQPSAKIAGPAVSGAVPGAMKFLEAFVERCGDVVDLLTWHIYPTEGDGSDAAALTTVREADRTLAHARAVWADPKRNPKGHMRPIEYGVTEYGLSWRTERPRFLSDQTGALWAMETTLRLAKGGAAVAHYFAYLATGFHGLIDNGGGPRPTFYAFRLLSGLKGRFVDAASDTSGIWAHAVRDGDTVNLVLINSHATRQTVQVDAGAFSVRGARWFDAAVAEREAEYGTLPARPQLVLPARSATVVTLQRPSP